MPPRKRAEPKPEPPADETLPPPAADTTNEDSAPSEPPAPTGDEPKKSDLQTVEQPCSICFPNGWADGAFSHGCDHGTWVRDSA